MPTSSLPLVVLPLLPALSPPPLPLPLPLSSPSSSMPPPASAAVWSCRPAPLRPRRIAGRCVGRRRWPTCGTPSGACRWTADIRWSRPAWYWCGVVWCGMRWWYPVLFGAYVQSVRESREEATWRCDHSRPSASAVVAYYVASTGAVAAGGKKVGHEGFSTDTNSRFLSDAPWRTGNMTSDCLNATRPTHGHVISQSFLVRPLLHAAHASS